MHKMQGDNGYEITKKKWKLKKLKVQKIIETKLRVLKSTKNKLKILNGNLQKHFKLNSSGLLFWTFSYFSFHIIFFFCDSILIIPLIKCHYGEQA